MLEISRIMAKTVKKGKTVRREKKKKKKSVFVEEFLVEMSSAHESTAGFYFIFFPLSQSRYMSGRSKRLR